MGILRYRAVRLYFAVLSDFMYYWKKFTDDSKKIEIRGQIGRCYFCVILMTVTGRFSGMVNNSNQK